MLSFEQMRAIYDGTEVLRRPTYGIISGYHELAYICLGASEESGYQTTEVRGRIHVSPRFVIRPPHLDPSYDEVFGETYVDRQLLGRVFGFLGFRGRPVECASERLTVKRLKQNIDHAVSENLDFLDRQEDITTGLFLTPDSRYFPISIERFIASVLEDEFRL